MGAEGRRREEEEEGGRGREVVTYEPSSRGIMNRYVYASDSLVNTDENGDDIDLWYFLLPPERFGGWQGALYGGTFEFDLSSFSGDFTPDMMNFDGRLNLVEIYCASCDLNKGTTIAFPLSSSSSTIEAGGGGGGFSGNTKSFVIPLNETSGWMKDPENVLIRDWPVPSKCEFVEMLSGITSLRILGDFTRRYECVSVDNVVMRSGKPRGRKQLPPCAQHTPDGRRCTCR